MKATDANTFDAIAPFYDRLAEVVFGRELRNAQVHFLDQVSASGKLLILGGGTGWLLGEVLQINKHAEVWYVEASKRMIDLSKKKCELLSAGRVHYVQGTEESLPEGIVFDGIITNFYLDLFSHTTLPDVMQRILKALSSNGVWLVSDFVDPASPVQRMLLFLMYWFFRIVSRIEASRLPDWQQAFSVAGLTESKSMFFYRNFVKSAVYFRNQ